VTPKTASPLAGGFGRSADLLLKGGEFTPANSSTRPDFKNPLDASRRMAQLNGTAAYGIQASGIGAETLRNALALKLQSASRSDQGEFALSPSAFDSRTGSSAGREVESFAKGLEIRTKGKKVGELIDAIGKKVAGREVSFAALPVELQAALGTAALGSIVAGGDYGTLNALGIKATSQYSAGKLGLTLKGSERGPRLEFFAQAKLLRSGEVTLDGEGKLDTDGHASGELKLHAKNGDLSFDGKVTAGDLPGKARVNGFASLGVNLGRALLKGDVDYERDRAGLDTLSYGGSIGVPLADALKGSVNVDVKPQETRYYLKVETK
jgi:hypothetical protein